jgi:hypothetical protein
VYSNGVGGKFRKGDYGVFRNDEGGALLSCGTRKVFDASSFMRQMRNECNQDTQPEGRSNFSTACSLLSGGAAFILARFYSHLPLASEAASSKDSLF